MGNAHWDNVGRRSADKALARKTGKPVEQIVAEREERKRHNAWLAALTPDERLTRDRALRATATQRYREKDPDRYRALRDAARLRHLEERRKYDREWAMQKRRKLGIPPRRKRTIEELLERRRAREKTEPYRLRHRTNEMKRRRLRGVLPRTIKPAGQLKDIKIDAAMNYLRLIGLWPRFHRTARPMPPGQSYYARRLAAYQFCRQMGLF